MSQAPDAGGEPVEIVDEDDRIVDVVPRHVMRERRLPHRCTYVLVLNERAEVYVHRRTETKDIYPGFLDVTAGGVIAVGETYDAGARRELEEELAIATDPVFRFRHWYGGSEGPVWGAVYDVVWDGPIRWQPEEVVWGAFVPVDEIDALARREPFCPDGLEVFDRWRRWKASGRP